MIVLMAGLPGTGKSTLARELVRRTPGALLDKDAIRAALFSSEDIEYSVKQDDFVMEIMLETASFLLHNAPARRILLDGRPFSCRYQMIASSDSLTNLLKPGGSSSAPVRMNPLAAVSIWSPTPRTPRTTGISRSTSK